MERQGYSHLKTLLNHFWQEWRSLLRSWHPHKNPEKTGPLWSHWHVRACKQHSTSWDVLDCKKAPPCSCLNLIKLDWLAPWSCWSWPSPLRHRALRLLRRPAHGLPWLPAAWLLRRRRVARLRWPAAYGVPLPWRLWQPHAPGAWSGRERRETSWSSPTWSCWVESPLRRRALQMFQHRAGQELQSSEIAWLRRRRLTRWGPKWHESPMLPGGLSQNARRRAELPLIPK